MSDLFVVSNKNVNCENQASEERFIFPSFIKMHLNSENFIHVRKSRLVIRYYGMVLQEQCKKPGSQPPTEGIH